MNFIRLAPGYRRLAVASGSAVAHEQFAHQVAEILRTRTLYAWAEGHPQHRVMQGRGPVYAAPLSSDGPGVVVRHSWRGGLLAPLLRDLYLPPTYAPVELALSYTLAHAGVPTPSVIAYATYPVAFVLRRVDVMTLEVRGQDLAAALAAAPTAEARQALIPVVARLLLALTEAGAWHQDLNARNILVAAAADGSARGVVLDVDRIKFVPSGDPHVLEANLARLQRSLTRLRGQGIQVFSDADIAAIRALARRDGAAQPADRAATIQATDS